MRFCDEELFTLDTLTAQAAHASFGQEVDVTTVEQGVTEAVRMLSHRWLRSSLSHWKRLALPANWTWACWGLPELPAFRGAAAPAALRCAGLNLPWWEMDGTNLRLPPLCPGAELRIEFYIEPAVDIIQTQFTTDVAFDGALDTDLKLAFTPSDALPIAPKVIPAAGYIHLPGTGGVYEYVGREIYVDPVGGTQFVLHNMTSPEWNRSAIPSLLAARSSSCLRSPAIRRWLPSIPWLCLRTGPSA